MTRGEEADDMDGMDDVVHMADRTGRERRSRTGPSTAARTEVSTGASTRARTGASKGESTAGPAHGPLLAIAADIALPLLVYYTARALGAGQAPALLLSG